MRENEPKKIAFVGTSCIGKTALIEVLDGRYRGDSGVAFVPEAARIFFAGHRDIPEEDRFSPAIQKRIQNLQLQLEAVTHSRNPSLIFCDRSVLDAVAYSRVFDQSEETERLFFRVSLWVPTYSKIFLLNPKDVPYAQDDIRQESEETRWKNHQAFVDLFEEKGIPYELLSGTVKERLARVGDVLASL